MKFLVLLLLVSGCSGCSSVFYYPDQIKYSSPDQMKSEFDDVRLVTNDKIKLHGQILKAKKPKSTVLYFHGNAQNLSSHFINLAWLTNYGYDVLVFDYRGYGRSHGAPDPKGLQEDAKAAINWALQYHKEKKHNKLILYGQSLGGIVSMRAILDHPQAGLFDLVVMDSTFSSYNDMAFDKLTSHWLTFIFSPLAYAIVSNSTSPEDDLENLQNPLLVIHGKRDTVVPFKHGKEIYDSAKSKKWFWEIEQGKHTDVFLAHNYQYRKKFITFLDKNISENK